MNRQRKVVITTTYNDLGMIIDTKAEELDLSAQPEPQWISCSERMPVLDEAVLATTAWNDITIAWRVGIDEWRIHEGNTNAETDDLIAWMPLPEPARLEDD